MKLYKKWRFLVIKFIYRYLILWQMRSDYWVLVTDDQYLQKPFGMKTCGFTDQIACNVLKYGWRAYEPPMGYIVSGLAKNLSLTFIDIGSNTGFYSLLAASSGAKKVTAYEPVPSINAVLKSNIHFSDLDIETHSQAIADKSGIMTIYLPASDQKYIETSASLNADFRHQHTQAIEIEVTSLDELTPRYLNSDLNHNDVCLVKIDVESYELPVLKGANNFLKAVKPIVIIELLNSNSDRQKIYDLMFFHGYVAFSLQESSMKKLTSLNMASASDNFLFIPSSRLALIQDILKSKMCFTVMD